jgi:tetratricopeptide (TPR) repeat protein
VLLAGGAAAVALGLASLLGGVLTEPSTSGAPPLAPRALADAGLAEQAGGVTAARVRELETRAATRSGDAGVLVALGFAYQLRWRETGDASYLPRSEDALRRALRVSRRDPNAVLGLGALALIRHEFRKGLVFGRRAVQLLPGSGRPYGVVGDALVELGRYPQAFAAFERMVTLRPGLASYARIAYARELTGDLEGALAAMRLALDAAGGEPESTAWAHVELAKLELRLQRVERAARHVRQASRAFPGYAPARLAEAKVEIARGRTARAIEAAREAAETVPTLENVTLLAGLLERAGRRAEARRQRATVAIVERLLRASGVAVDLESAAYRADLGRRPAETVRLARKARAARPSIYGDDALAWSLARAGRCAEALPFARRALRLGTKDALLRFHRGYAEGCAGDRSAMREWYARTLALDPAFSVRWAPFARRALSSRS